MSLTSGDPEVLPNHQHFLINNSFRQLAEQRELETSDSITDPQGLTNMNDFHRILHDIWRRSVRFFLKARFPHTRLEISLIIDQCPPVLSRSLAGKVLWKCVWAFVSACKPHSCLAISTITPRPLTFATSRGKLARKLGRRTRERNYEKGKMTEEMSRCFAERNGQLANYER